MAGRRDFAADEWGMLQRAMVAAGVIVSLADGTADPEEMHELTMQLRGARFAHRSQLVHEVADMPALNSGSPAPQTTYEDYREPALESIRAAVGIVGQRAPDELPSFQQFLVELAEAVADANRKADALGVGTLTRVPEEREAIEAVKGALGL
jgi:hypothetical protein